MEYKKLGKTDLKISKLGFGCMRFRAEDGSSDMMSANKPIDKDYTIRLLHKAIEEGVNYFDTAYVYHGGKSETLLGEAFRDGKRNKIQIATKLPAWLAKTPEDFDKLLDEQLKRLETDYLDVYLVHALSGRAWDKAYALGITDFLDKIKKQGKVKAVGFSFHDEYDAYKTILDAYNWDVSQIQLNYLDENYQAGIKGMQDAAKKDIGIIVMEPLKGGKLAINQPVDVMKLWDKYPANRTPADWALRWVWDKEEVACVLSGMHSFEELDQNLVTASTSSINTLTHQEIETYKKVKDIYRKRSKVSCTACGYCMPCPVGVEIPTNFKLYNDVFMFDDNFFAPGVYKTLKSEQKASACIACGKCEEICPQQIKVSEVMKDVTETFEKK